MALKMQKHIKWKLNTPSVPTNLMCFLSICELYNNETTLKIVWTDGILRKMVCDAMAKHRQYY